VGGIISLWWAASFRYGGRHHLVLMGGFDRNQQMRALNHGKPSRDLVPRRKPAKAYRVVR
jgi:hypothetical protein